MASDELRSKTLLGEIDSLLVRRKQTFDVSAQIGIFATGFVQMVGPFVTRIVLDRLQKDRFGRSCLHGPAAPIKITSLINNVQKDARKYQESCQNSQASLNLFSVAKFGTEPCLGVGPLPIGTGMRNAESRCRFINGQSSEYA